MSRAFSLALLITSFWAVQCWQLHSQTWQIDNTGTKPCIDVRNDGRVRVVWIDNTVIRTAYHSGGAWYETEIVNDGIQHTQCKFLYHSFDNSFWVVWDSLGYGIVECYQDSNWHHTILNSVPFSWHIMPATVSICEGDSGKVNFCWDQYYKSGRWNTTDTTITILPAWGMWPHLIGDDNFFIDISWCDTLKRPVFNSVNDWVSHGGSDGVDLYRVFFDTIWSSMYITGQGGFMGNPYGAYWKSLGVSNAFTDEEVHVYYSKVYQDSGKIISTHFVPGAATVDTQYTIADNVKVHSGAIAQRTQPLLVWSDSNSIYLNAYNYPSWSTPPVLITGTISSCKNPSVVVENDSIAWVAFEGLNGIYVTRATIPTGVAGQPEQPAKKQPISLAACPNPSRGGFRFEKRGNINGNNTISLYDVAGRRVRCLENADAWDGRDEGGRRAAPGVYFARMVSGGETANIKLTIIK